MKNDDSKNYRYYIYDFLIGQVLLTIDIVEKKMRLDRFNIYGQCYSLEDNWKKITNATIRKAYEKGNKSIDKYIVLHFPLSENINITPKEDLLYKCNDYDDCILFLAKYGKENQNLITNNNCFNYYKKYLKNKNRNIDELNEVNFKIEKDEKEGMVYES